MLISIKVEGTGHSPQQFNLKLIPNNAKTFKLKGLKEGWVTAQRKWTEVTKDTGVGNPKMATQEKGEIFLKLVIKKISKFFEELHHADLKNMYDPAMVEPMRQELAVLGIKETKTAQEVENELNTQFSGCSFDYWLYV